MVNGKRSPLKNRPLNVAGQSTDNRIQDLLYEDVNRYFTFIAIFVAITATLWVYYFIQWKYLPLISSFLAFSVIVYCAVKLVKLKKDLKQLALGRDGERIVAEILDDLRSKGYFVFHDIVVENFNIDHVLISPQGIYTVETKTRSKSENDIIESDGENIIIAGKNVGNKIIIQAETETRWLKNILRDSTGKEYYVFPVIVYPDWFVSPMPEKLKKRVWVLNPKALSSFIEKEPPRIEESDVHLAAFHLSRYIRLYGA